ncbi:AfsR/SARP family transcriptional regulator [Marinisporobacter balticus]|uniref:DNA-binding SARP family transcriptional activator n=1 Tax=Marinisporobacter balticus TaxID=2018667 RepID=A0A4V2SC43_9FIRM|nr:BTAD domain-containing putative transcriptional regulator [Marinisporobacter balticus]TCO77940.1 DNA-binding SARP family transcriptional activator [Marinisporobacter balticus]
MAKLEIYVLGNLKIDWENKHILEKLSDKAIGLFCYLAVNKGKKLSRDKLAAYFWDSSNINSARYNLRYNLWTLRKVIKQDENGKDILLSKKDICMINPEANFYMDIFEINDIFNQIDEKNLHRYKGNLERLKKLYKGEFLEGFYLKKSIEFNDWVFYEREKFQRKYIDILYKLTYLYEANAEYDKAINLLEEMIMINPLKEEIYVQLIKVYIKIGDRKAALNQYERCCTILREELNIGPMEHTKKLYEKIKETNVEFNKFNTLEEKLIEHKINTNFQIILYSKEKFKRIRESLSKEKEKTIINNPCYPLNNIEYYWISNLVEKIIFRYHKKDLKQLEDYYWQDILRIQSGVLRIDENLVVKDYLSVKTEKNRIFNGIEHLINELLKISSIIILIEDFHYMDADSFECLKYYLFKNQNMPIEIILCGNKKNKKIEELKKYMNITE